MVQFNKHLIKDIGLQREVEEALPYAVVGGAWEGSFDESMVSTSFFNALNYLVPAGHQLKILFLRVWTQETTGARYAIVQSNPTSATTPAHSAATTWPVVGNTPTGFRDYPMLEAPGAEVLTGNLKAPVHVLEGSVDFRVLAQFPGAPVGSEAWHPATGARYGMVWWGCVKIPEPTR